MEDPLPYHLGISPRPVQNTRFAVISAVVTIHCFAIRIALTKESSRFPFITDCFLSWHISKAKRTLGPETLANIVSILACFQTGILANLRGDSQLKVTCIGTESRHEHVVPLPCNSGYSDSTRQVRINIVIPSETSQTGTLSLEYVQLGIVLRVLAACRNRRARTATNSNKLVPDSRSGDGSTTRDDTGGVKSRANSRILDNDVSSS
jgi:hypothetical protein